MRPIPGPRPADLRELTRVEDRLTFVYVERCKVNRQDNAITATDEKGVLYFPSASVAALMLGPGTDITHQAMVVLSDSGASVVWVGEHGVRCYAHGRPLARSAKLLSRQAACVSDRRERLRVARLMYDLRFPDGAITGTTMQQLRGHEGARVKRKYRELAKEFGVAWQGRNYVAGSFDESDDVNQAVTAATGCLYGLVHAVVVALGCSPGLGFIHTGHDLSFVYDIADLYKMEVAVPTAFEVVADEPEDLPSAVRLAMRDKFAQSKLLTQVVHDVKTLLGDEDEAPDWDVLELWNGDTSNVPAGFSWSPWPGSSEW